MVACTVSFIATCSDRHAVLFSSGRRKLRRFRSGYRWIIRLLRLQQSQTFFKRFDFALNAVTLASAFKGSLTSPPLRDFSTNSRARVAVERCDLAWFNSASTPTWYFWDSCLLFALCTVRSTTGFTGVETAAQLYLSSGGTIATDTASGSTDFARPRLQLRQTMLLVGSLPTGSAAGAHHLRVSKRLTLPLIVANHRSWGASRRFTFDWAGSKCPSRASLSAAQARTALTFFVHARFKMTLWSLAQNSASIYWIYTSQ